MEIEQIKWASCKERQNPRVVKVGIARSLWRLVHRPPCVECINLNVSSAAMALNTGSSTLGDNFGLPKSGKRGESSGEISG